MLKGIYLEKIKELPEFIRQMSGLVILVIVIITFASKTVNMQNNNCNKLNKTYTNFPTISPVSSNASILNNSLRDFYIKTAYNCCSPGYFKNSLVDLCDPKLFCTTVELPSHEPSQEPTQQPSQQPTQQPTEAIIRSQNFKNKD